MIFEKVSIKNSIRLKISAVVHYPKGASNKLVILLPGYLDSKDYPHLVGLAEDLSNNGYTVVRFDPTGIWESGGNISDHTISRQFEDVKDVLDYALHKNDYQFIALGGHSRAGFISILYAIGDHRVSAVFGLMPPYALIRTVNDDKIQKWKRDGFRVSLRDIPGSKDKKEFRVPYSNIEDTQQYNVLTEINKLHVPLLLVAGELDDVVLADDVKKIFDKANEPKKFLVMKGIDHDYRHHPEQIKTVNTEVIKFLEQFSY